MSLVTWILTPEEAQSVVNIVAKLPYEQVSGLIEKLVTQARTSQQPQVPTGPIPREHHFGEAVGGQSTGLDRVPQAEFVNQLGENLAAAHGYNNAPLPAGWDESQAR